MASGSASYAYHSTLSSASVVDIVLLTDNSSDKVEVFNRGTANNIYFTVDGTNPDPTTTPIKDCYIVSPGQSYEAISLGGSDEVRIRGAANDYSVTGQKVIRDR